MREKLVAAILIAALFAPHLATAEALSFAPGLRVAGCTAVSFPGIAPAQFKTDKTARLGSRLILLPDYFGERCHARCE